jgi:hypothetical protein
LLGVCDEGKKGDQVYGKEKGGGGGWEEGTHDMGTHDTLGLMTHGSVLCSLLTSLEFLRVDFVVSLCRALDCSWGSSTTLTVS